MGKKMDLTQALRIRLIELMKSNKVNGNQLALLSGIDRSTLNKFLRGKVKSMRIETLTLICQSLNLSLKDFFDCSLFNDVEVND